MVLLRQKFFASTHLICSSGVTESTEDCFMLFHTLPSSDCFSFALTEGQDSTGRFQTLTVNGSSQVFRWIPAGSFLMGSPKSEPDRWSDEAQRRVEIPVGYWLADTACTQAFYETVMSKNPSHFRGTDLPVECVSWNGAQAFILKLNAHSPGLGLRLPSEAEWEYACRAGTTTAYSFGDEITKEQVNFESAGTVAVKSLPANAWGLHEMHGNVWEWCEDEFVPARRVLRGGSWIDFDWFAYAPDGRNRSIGFRLARGAC
jgi:formylglycine-generating enzyme